MANKYNNWIYRSLDLGLAVNGNGDIEISEMDGESGERYNLTFGNSDAKEEIIQRIGTEIYSWIELMKDEVDETMKMEINVKNYGSNISILVNDYIIDVYHDNCTDFTYDENLENIIDHVSNVVERDLTDEEKQIVEEKVGGWLDAHSAKEKDVLKAR